MSKQQPRRRPPAPVRNPSRQKSSSRWWLIGGIALVLVVAVVIALAAGGGGDDDTAAAKHETGTVTVEGTPLPAYQGPNVTDQAVGDTAPTLVGSGFDAQPVTIEPTGKPQVVMFLAHWCPHCQAEVPRVVELAKDGAFDGVDVAAVATGTTAEAPNYPPSAWLAREDWPFPVMVDSLQFTAAQAYGLPSYPYFVFLDGDGTVLARATGEVPSDTLRDLLDAMRSGDPLPSATGESSGAG